MKKHMHVFNILYTHLCDYGYVKKTVTEYGTWNRFEVLYTHDTSKKLKSAKISKTLKTFFSSEIELEKAKRRKVKL